MGYTVTFTFAANTIIRSSQVNQNFTDGSNWSTVHDATATGIHGVGAGTIVGTANQNTFTDRNTFNKETLFDAGVAVNLAGAAANIKIEAATTTVSNDSFKVTGINAALAADNRVFGSFLDGTSYQGLASDITIDLTNAGWAKDGRGDIADMIIRVLLLKDNSGTIKVGAAYKGNRQTILNADDTTTGAATTATQHVLVNSALTSDAEAIEVGYLRVSRNDTTKVLTVLTTHLGSADGKWQDCVSNVVGFTSDPGMDYYRWTQVGRTVILKAKTLAGTSNSTLLQIEAPLKAKDAGMIGSGFGRNNSVNLTSPIRVDTTAGTTTINFYLNFTAAGWANSGTKFGGTGVVSYEME